jgi:hypothetical protein
MTNLKEYERVKNALKKKFDNERTGDQIMYIDQTKLFKPLIDEHKLSTNTIQKNLTAGQESLTNTLVPFTEELRKRNEQVDNLQMLPFYDDVSEIKNIPQSTPKKAGIVIDLDKMLSETDKENLQDMSLPLPSEVIKQGNYEYILGQLKTLNRQYGQFTGKKSKKDEKEKQIYKSRRETLEMYKLSLDEQMKALKYKSGEGLRKCKLYKLKRGRGCPKKYPDTKFYNSPDELVQELNKLVIAKEAGNTGIDNVIVSALDELLNIKAITKNEYDKVYKNIFT